MKFGAKSDSSFKCVDVIFNVKFGLIALVTY